MPTKNLARQSQILADKNIDAVILLVPHHLHLPLALQAARAGKHILLEKPIARTLEESDQIIAAAKKARITLLIGHQQRYVPEHRRIKELVDQNAIGQIFLAQSSHHQDFQVPQTNWWRDKQKAGGGCVLGAGIHKLDLLLWYLGPVKEVFATCIHDNSRLEGEVAATIQIKFRSGALASYVINWAATGPMWETLSLFGKTGRIVLPKSDFDRAGPTLIAGPDGKESPLKLPRKKYPSMWSHFAHCIRTGDQPLTSAHQARTALQLILAIHQSMQTNKPVQV